MPAPPLRIDVLTLFPAVFDGFLSQSILKRAIENGLVQIERFDIRSWAEGKHRQVNDRPFGGGPGMVLMAPPVVEAAEAVRQTALPAGRLIMLSPRVVGSTSLMLQNLLRKRGCFCSVDATRDLTNVSSRS